MSNADRQFRPNEAEVAAKVIDGEAIIMNLTSGAYYSMTGTGALIWTLVEDGHALADIAGALSAAYDVPLAAVRADLDSLADQLVQEGLVQEVVPSAATNGRPLVCGAANVRYAPPELNKYTDMEDLLALDPPMPSIANIGVKFAAEG